MTAARTGRFRPAAFAVGGVVLIIAGIILNQWTLGTLLSPDGVIGARSLRARRPLLAVHLKNREADRCARTQAAVDSAPGGWAERHGKW